MIKSRFNFANAASDYCVNHVSECVWGDFPYTALCYIGDQMDP